MAAKSLQQHIQRLIGFTLMVVSLAILLAVWFSTGSHVRTQISNDLEVGNSVLTQLLETREQQLLNSAEVLTADFGFKQAVASGDAATAQSALDNHGERIQADLMALLSLDGTVTVTTRSALATGQAFPAMDMVQSTLNAGSATAVVQLDTDLYQVIMLPVKVPVPVALTVIGFRINEALAQELRQVTHLDVTFAAESTSSAPVRISTMPRDEMENALATSDAELNRRLPFLSQLRHTTKRYPLSEQNRIYVYLSTAVDSAFARFDELQLEIILISLVAIGLSLLGGALVARNLTRPLRMLAELAAEIAAGHYRRDVQVSRNVREIGDLMSAFNTMQADLSEREARIIYQAHHDPLTGLINRQHVLTLLDDMLQQPDAPALLVACLNILDFRIVNDTFGHNVGDSCLKQISTRLQELGGEQHLAARLGGDEFLFIAPQKEMATTANNILTALQQPYSSHELDINLHFSMGVAASPQDARSANALVNKASIALDLSRRQRQGIVYYERKMEEAYLKRLTMLADLKAAIQANDGQLKMYYQPKVCARTLTVSRFEALIRWIHPHHGFVPPDQFIPLAEQAGLINALTEWVVGAVIRQISDWQQQDFTAQVAVNLSAQDLSREQLLEHVNNLLQRHGVAASALSFEITESELMRDAKAAIQLLEKFRGQGFHLAIDDFGTGYSSLSQLKNMPVTELKIDRSFVMQLDSLEDDQIIVKSTIDLAHSFSLEIVAEGVENQAALQLLQQWGIDWIQGYYFSRPLPAGEVLPWVLQFTASQVISATR